MRFWHSEAKKKMAGSENEKEIELHSRAAIERDTSVRAFNIARSTITRLEKRIAVLEAQLAEARCELENLRLKPPALQPVQLDPRTTALLVLDLTRRCDDPRLPCHKLVPRVAQFTRDARDAGVFVAFTIINGQKGRPEGALPEIFERRPEEPIFYTDSYSKFQGTELNDTLRERGIKTLVLIGSAANFACLYTATEAAQHFGYEVVVPSDGVVSWTEYEHDYALFQLSVLPGGTSRNFRFTELSLIAFSQ